MGFAIGRSGHVRETYPQAAAAGGAAASIVPLSRQKFIDGDTTQTGLNGSVASPFKTIAQFMASRGNASVADAGANYVGWLMPALNGYVENVSFPAYAATELRGDSYSGLGGITGNVTWANSAGAHSAATPYAALHNVNVLGTITLSDDGGAPGSLFLFSGDEIGGNSALITGAITGTTQHLLSMVFYNAQIQAGISVGSASSSPTVLLTSSNCVGSIIAGALVSTGSFVTASAITLSATGVATFTNTTFATGSNPVLTATGGATFDGPSWRSFLEAGGTKSATTVVLVVGGYAGAPVGGTALTAASTSVALNGVGATSGFTNGGNHYTSASNTPTAVTLLTAGALIGDVIRITRNTLGTGVLAVINGGGGGGTLGTIPVNARGFVDARYDGTNWGFVAGGSMLA